MFHWINLTFTNASVVGEYHSYMVKKKGPLTLKVACGVLGTCSNNHSEDISNLLKEKQVCVRFIRKYCQKMQGPWR